MIRLSRHRAIFHFRLVGVVLLVAGCASGNARTPNPSSASTDSAVIRASIERGARGFERGDPDSILAHYSEDVVLSYPGIPDQDYADLVKAYGELRNRPITVTARTVPTFDEILIAGDLAVVRVRWTTTISEATRDGSPAWSSTRYLRDLQIWRREPSGQWRFIRGMHYRDSTLANGD